MLHYGFVLFIKKNNIGEQSKLIAIMIIESLTSVVDYCRKLFL